jgi:hypothetical protein
VTDNLPHSELESALSRFFFSPWETTKSSSDLIVEQDELSVPDWEEVINTVDAVRSLDLGENLILTVEEDSQNFEYRTNWGTFRLCHQP